MIGTVRGWGKLETIALAVGLAFVSGYAFTMVPLFRGGTAWRSAARVALAADTAWIAIMERLRTAGGLHTSNAGIRCCCVHQRV